MKIGFFGGAFDPFHSEHEEAIRASFEELKLDTIVLVPSNNPPHKDSFLTDFYHRAAMLSIWTKGKKEIVIDTIESQTGAAKNYSYQIIKLLKAKYIADEYFYIIGGDSMCNFRFWVKPEVITKELTLAVIAREGFESADTAIQHAQKAYNANIIKLAAKGKEVSSGELKARLQLKLDTTDFIDSRILDYISANGLYREDAALVDRLRHNVSPSLFMHCARTAVFAARYCTLAKVSYHKAFLAGLLHDCAKEITDSTEGYPTESLQVAHQYKGAEVAAKEYNILDKEILDAIACHTTGKPSMTALDKLIYIADKLEDGRDYACANEMRSAMHQGLDAAFLTLLKHNANYLKTRGIISDGLTNECLNYYTNTN